jgi:ParB-like chromosome segregation protein Spo0J
MTRLELISIDDLILSENNPRTISKDAMHKLCKSIQDDPAFLIARPILVNQQENGSYHVYAGNQRVRACKMLGWEHVHCLVYVELPEKVMMERLLKDNMHAGEFDYECLANEFDLETLLSLGFEPSHFDIGLDITNPDEKESEKKSKMCPECGHEF